ncbi:hypothetical protein IU468_17350 [Nocardia farcinica]|uniref:Uncharacterized protein n=1 Tax=Nocardia farcinica TaxID=37329 RepID=A0A449GY56_NOCFR|nr:hypothetical protein [Nocardia farcinica]MBF6258074.1 hypothetical protein [Nocardia farcinica]MBF6384045.1 hypothetical protein [Nocardia farcinica]MBF6445142.1 hypothetical protein [Nocardia farcinica]SUE28457.1 Uncharacterised protein [Nocardia farcinica]VFA90688.1 Uncharacterised protein [Nocardia farcinica]
MRPNSATARVRCTLAAAVVGAALVVSTAPAASALPAGPLAVAPVASPAESGSSSGSGYLLEAALNALCVLTGSQPGCWGSVPR